MPFLLYRFLVFDLENSYYLARQILINLFLINKNIYDNFLSKGEFHIQEKEYFSEIESFIKKNEIRKKEHILESNYETLRNYWEIGRLIVEAQNGNSKAKYGDELIKKWSKEFTNKYGKGYDNTGTHRCYTSGF